MEMDELGEDEEERGYRLDLIVSCAPGHESSDRKLPSVMLNDSRSFISITHRKVFLSIE